MSTHEDICEPRSKDACVPVRHIHAGKGLRTPQRAHTKAVKRVMTSVMCQPVATGTRLYVATLLKQHPRTPGFKDITQYS